MSRGDWDLRVGFLVGCVANCGDRSKDGAGCAVGRYLAIGHCKRLDAGSDGLRIGSRYSDSDLAGLTHHKVRIIVAGLTGFGDWPALLIGASVLACCIPGRMRIDPNLAPRVNSRTRTCGASRYQRFRLITRSIQELY